MIVIIIIIIIIIIMIKTFIHELKNGNIKVQSNAQNTPHRDKN